jgi:hypothetical protein
MAHDLRIDLAAAVDGKISHNETRYTIQKHKGIAKKAQMGDSLLGENDPNQS